MLIKCPKCGASDDINISHIPPGKALLRCESCFNSFEIIIKVSDIPLAECVERGDVLEVTCPYCREKFNTSLDIASRNIFWECPSCESILRVAETNKENTIDEKVPEIDNEKNSVETLQLGEISSDGLEAFEEQLGVDLDNVTTEPIAIESDIADEFNKGMLSPLIEKDRFTSHFTVKIGGAEMGPISYNVLENWVRSGMLPRDALVSKVDENKFHRAEQMPELLKIYDGENVEHGKGIRDLLKEESTGTAILHGINCGLLGGLIGGVIASPVVLLDFWTPTPLFSPVLSALILVIGTSIIGAGMAGITSVLGLWIINYSWITLVQIIISSIFAIAIFAANMIMTHYLWRDSVISALGVFSLAFIIGYFTILFHHKLYEKEV
ncbi:hypothetical protein J7L68_06100 [bacterium]|nr:hypothetical protein [bacterium]